MAAADFTGDAKADLVVGAGASGGPRVRVFDMTTGKQPAGPLGDFFAFDQAFTGGVSLGADWKAGDVDADGSPDLVVGTGAGVSSRVKVFSGKTGAALGDFAPFGPTMTAGVRVALCYADDDQFADVVAATGPGVPATVRVFTGATGTAADLPTAEFQPFGPTATGGVNLAATNDPVVPTMSQPQVTPSPVMAGASMSVTVTVTGTSTTTPTGSVSFTAVSSSAGSISLGSATLVPSGGSGGGGGPSGGGGPGTGGGEGGSLTATAKITATAPAAGSYTVVATYSGDTAYDGLATSSGLTVLSPPPPPPSGGTGNGPVWVEPDTDWVVKGEATTFWVDTNLDPEPTYSLVEWDFNYNGTVFVPAASGTAWSATTTFTAVGNRTVAARLTKPDETTSVVTAGVEVHYPPPDLHVPQQDLQATVGQPILFPVTATSETGIASVQYEFSYFYEDYLIDPTVTTLSPMYTFTTWGEYDVWVTVTGGDGQTAEDGFHVSVTEFTADFKAEVSGMVNGKLTPNQVDEGSAATFTVYLTDPDRLDTLTISADWLANNQYDQVLPENYTYDPDDRTIRFDHVYADEPKPYAVKIRVTDDGGLYDPQDGLVNLNVNKVAPQASLVTVMPGGQSSGQIQTIEAGNREIWTIQPGETLRLSGVTFPSEWEESGATYWFKVCKGPATENTGEEEDQPVPEYVLDTSTPGTVYEVSAWVTDRANVSSVPRSFTVVVEQWKAWGSEESGAGNRFGLGGDVLRSADITQAYKAMGSVSIATPPPEAAIGSASQQFALQYPVNTTFLVNTKLNQQTFDLAASKGYAVVYQYRVLVEALSWSFFGGESSSVISDTTYTSTWPYVLGEGMGSDQRTSVIVNVGFTTGGQLMPGPAHIPFGRIVVTTPRTTSGTQQFVDWVGAINAAVSTFGNSVANQLRDILFDESKRTQFLENIKTGLWGGVTDFVTRLTTTDLLKNKVFEWLFGATDFNGVDWSSADAVSAAVLKWAGLDWSKVYQIARDELGDGNLAALEKVFGDPDPQNPKDGLLSTLNPTVPTTLISFLNNANNGFGDVVKAATDKIKEDVNEGFGKIATQLLMKLSPAGGPLALLKGLIWIGNNGDQMCQVKNIFIDLIGNLTSSTAQFRQSVFNATPVMLSFAADQFGLGGVKTAIQSAVKAVPIKVEKTLRDLVRAAATAAPPVAAGPHAAGTTWTASVAGGPKAQPPYDGMIGTAREFQYGGKTYRLFVAQDASKDGKSGTNAPWRKVSVKIVDVAANKLVKVLHSADFDDQVHAGSKADLTALESAAKALVVAVKPTGNTPPAANTAALLGAQTADVRKAEDKLIGHIFKDACTALNAGCFAAGTKLQTPHGFQAVEDFAPGDVVMARDEHDALGPVEAKVVEEVFVRFAGVYHLHVGGQVVRTTGEHPFYAHDRGWVRADELQPGEWVYTAAGRWVSVEEVFDTGEWEQVYNLRVADHHTYFVGDDDWGFALWAHNTYVSDEVIDALAAGWTQSWSTSPSRINRSVQQVAAWALRKAYNEWGQDAYGNRAETYFHDGLQRMKCRLDNFESNYNVEWQPASILGRKVVAYTPLGNPAQTGPRSRLDAAVTSLPTANRATGHRPRTLEAPHGTKLPGTVLFGYDISQRRYTR